MARDDLVDEDCLLADDDDDDRRRRRLLSEWLWSCSSSSLLSSCSCTQYRPLTLDAAAENADRVESIDVAGYRTLSCGSRMQMLYDVTLAHNASTVHSSHWLADMTARCKCVEMACICGSLLGWL